MIRKATQQDLSQVEATYNELFDHEAATTSYTNWKKGLYPTLDYARQAQEQGTLYVGEENGEIYGSVILNHIQPEEYQKIPWTFDAKPEEVVVIHTLCIRPSAARKGYGKEFCQFSEEFARQAGAKVIRLDTYEGNLPARSFYPKMGYRFAGSTKFHFQQVIWEVLFCYEKQL